MSTRSRKQNDNGARRIVGLDIGTNKVAAIVGEINNDGEL